jgi:hypothetical protein
MGIFGGILSPERGMPYWQSQPSRPSVKVISSSYKRIFMIANTRGRELPKFRPFPEPEDTLGCDSLPPDFASRAKRDLHSVGDGVTASAMFTRSLRLGHVRQRRHYVTRNDIRYPMRRLELGVPGNCQTVSMQPHPYSPAASRSESSSPPSQNPSSSASASLSSTDLPPPPPPPTLSSRPATSEEPKDKYKSTHLTIMSPNRINADVPSIDDQAPSRLSNPFDTHKVFKQLEKDFASPIAHTLMRTARGLLIDRIAKARREGVDVKEAENVSTCMFRTRHNMTLHLCSVLPIGAIPLPCRSV